MATSGGPYESYSTKELKELLRFYQRELGKPSKPSMDLEDKRANNQRISNHINACEGVVAELRFREQAKEERAERDEQRAIAKAARDQARADRIAKEEAEAKENPVNIALGAYFQRTRITDPPIVTTPRVELAWTHNGRQFIAFYTSTTNTLQVWMLVRPGTLGATVINDGEYMPADTFGLIGQAYSAEAKAPRRR